MAPPQIHPHSRTSSATIPATVDWRLLHRFSWLDDDAICDVPLCGISLVEHNRVESDDPPTFSQGDSFHVRLAAVREVQGLRVCRSMAQGAGGMKEGETGEE
ncbi:hypothetical protein DsansV1_C08g0079201 [Dioscorea sansibarensis]